MAFSILYGDGVNTDPAHHAFSIGNYIDSAAKNLGFSSCPIDGNGFSSLIAALAEPEFPHVDGLDKASPFKKAAWFFVWFVSSKIATSRLPDGAVKKEIIEIENHQNVVLAYLMATDCLHHATIHRDNGAVVLENRIRLSKHSFCDFVEAWANPVPAYDFKKAAILFEQMAYRWNPVASYDPLI